MWFADNCNDSTIQQFTANQSETESLKRELEATKNALAGGRAAKAAAGKQQVSRARAKLEEV